MYFNNVSSNYMGRSVIDRSYLSQIVAFFESLYEKIYIKKYD
jgi:hypothetical protein